MPEISLAQLGRINHPLARDHPGNELIRPHLKGEYGDGIAVCGCSHVTCNVQCEGCLTHGRAGGEYDQIIAVEACSHEVEITVACRDACCAGCLAGTRLNLLVDFVHDRLH